MFKLLILSVAAFAVFAHSGSFVRERFSTKRLTNGRSMLALMCVPENCTTLEMRDKIRSCMPDLAQKAWNECENTCDGTITRELRECLLDVLANVTTAQARNLFRSITDIDKLQV
ncbi:uncharacterized protein LOC111626982 [Centruroides sculpturatus]|uniref:uncharacterized protein LOC111626982 n=1 Tax=Centruroides sculpturatus TaxID=218467 RepID=UPI000C6CDCF8|nr:uncharacterized protein LOC111626982 [Centruroides sculpturatus]